MKNLKEEQQNWIQARTKKFEILNASWTKEELKEAFNIYSYITDKPHRPTSCNRCIKNTLNVIWNHYKNTI